jgi:hypothetical protein
MAAGLGFKTFVTGEVLTAADTNGYLMQGVNVFANAAARTAAITSPQEGQMSYLKDTNSTEYYSGSAWVSVGGASGLTLISTTTIGSAVSSISLPDNTFSSTYDNYKIIISLARSTASSSSGAINMRYRASGTDNSAAQYAYNGFESRETTLSNVQQTSQTSQRVGYYLDTLWSRTAIAIDLCGPNIAKQTAVMVASVSMDGGTRVAHQLNGWHNVDAAYDSATFLIATGTLTNGRISVYGYQN